ncbi:hypothetical protein D3C85_871230 [compost metagenome]
MQRCLAILAATGDLHLILFAYPQAHQADQAVAGRRLAGNVQLDPAAETLCGLANQCGGPRMQATAVGHADAGAGFAMGIFDGDRRKG